MGEEELRKVKGRDRGYGCHTRSDKKRTQVNI